MSPSPCLPEPELILLQCIKGPERLHRLPRRVAAIVGASARPVHLSMGRNSRHASVRRLLELTSVKSPRRHVGSVAGMSHCKNIGTQSMSCQLRLLSSKNNMWNLPSLNSRNGATEPLKISLLIPALARGCWMTKRAIKPHGNGIALILTGLLCALLGGFSRPARAEDANFRIEDVRVALVGSTNAVEANVRDDTFSPLRNYVQLIGTGRKPPANADQNSNRLAQNESTDAV